MLFHVEAWHIFMLLTADSDPDKLPINADKLQLILESWIESGIFGR